MRNVLKLAVASALTVAGAPTHAQDGGPLGGWDLPSGEEGDLGAALRLFDDRTADVVGDLKESPRTLESSELAQTAAELCREGSQPACLRSQALAATADRMRAAAATHLRCAVAAQQMEGYYKLNDPRPEVAAAYDLWCFGSFVARADEPIPEEPRAAVLDGTLLSALGVVMVNGVPQCSGLLTPAGRFVTARHCADPIRANPYVVQASTGKSWMLELVGAGLRIGAAHDWAIYDLAGVDSIAAVKVTMVPLTRATSQPVTLVAAWPHLGRPLDATVPLASAMRYPRDGLCEFISERSGCLLLNCQTIKGFSGAPIFRPGRGGEAPEFVGLVQGANTSSARCGLELLNDTTLAVSAAQVKGDF